MAETSKFSKAVNSLSGRFLILTVIFVMLAEVFIFVPSVARFREDYLLARLDRAQIASLALLDDNMVTPEIEKELLANAGVYNVVLRRDEMRQLILSSPVPGPIYASYDMRMPSAWLLIKDATMELFHPEQRIIRVIGNPVRNAGVLIEVTMDTQGLRSALIDYGIRILLLSAVISIITAIFLFMAVRRFLVKPIKRVVGHLAIYAADPEDARNVIMPNAGVTELREAEDALKSMQTQLTSALRQRERLAQLGGAVSKISHDLRNILTVAQLFADRMENSDDPMVKKAAPKLEASISRAIRLCESTLAFGKAEEAPPMLDFHDLDAMVADIFENENLARGGDQVAFFRDIPSGMRIRCDGEQMYRIITNLTRNARQAIIDSGKKGEIRIHAVEDSENWRLRLSDNGPGLPKRAKDHLFVAFQGGTRKEGSGLGLSIAAELVRGHGGKLELLRSDAEGTTFEICIPKGNIV